MSDDRLAEEVARVMREQDDAVDAALEAYARGALAPEARAELEARAARDPELARALALFAPLSSGAIDAAVRATEPARAPGLAGAARGPRWARRAVAAAAAIAAAVVAVVALGPGAPAPLPAYAVEARVGDAALRGEGARRPRVRADSLIEVTLVPERRVEGAVSAALFARTDGTWRASAVVPEISAEGGVRWRATAEALTGVRSGTVALWPVARRPGEEGAPPGDPAAAPVVVVVYSER